MTLLSIFAIYFSVSVMNTITMSSYQCTIHTVTAWWSHYIHLITRLDTLSHFGLSTTGTQAVTSMVVSSALGSLTQDFSDTSSHWMVGTITCLQSSTLLLSSLSSLIIDHHQHLPPLAPLHGLGERDLHLDGVGLQGGHVEAGLLANLASNGHYSKTASIMCSCWQLAHAANCL